MNEKQRKKAIKALKTGDLETIKTLVGEDKGWLTLPLKKYMYPIHIATHYGHIEVVSFLLKIEPQQVNLTDIHKQTALIFAAAGGHTEIVQLLVSSSTDLNVTTNRPDHKSHRWTALQWSMENHHADSEKILQEAFRQATEKALNKNPKLLTSPDQNGELLLFKSARLYHIEAVKYLISKGADKHAYHGRYKFTLLHIAAQQGHVELVRFLLENTIPEYVNQPDIFGQTALHLAAFRGYLEVVECLVSAGANLFAKISKYDNKGKMPIDLAIENQCDPVVSFLVAELAKNQPIESLLHYVQSDTAAIGLMGYDATYAPVLLKNAVIRDLLQTSPYCESTENDLRVYHKRVNRRRGSWYAEIDKSKGTLTVFTPPDSPVIGEGSFGKVRVFISSDGKEKRAVKSNRGFFQPARIKEEKAQMIQAYPDVHCSLFLWCDNRDKKKYRLVMPYREGNTLHHWAEKENSAHQLAKLFYHVAAELFRINERQCIHGDAMTWNIIVSPTSKDQYDIYFIDFGFAYSAREEAVKVPIESDDKRYPPERSEQNKGITKASPKQDVFTLAAAFNMILAIHPNSDELKTNFPLIFEFIRSASNINPAKRPSFMTFCDDLKEELHAAETAAKAEAEAKAEEEESLERLASMWRP